MSLQTGTVASVELVSPVERDEDALDVVGVGLVVVAHADAEAVVEHDGVVADVGVDVGIATFHFFDNLHSLDEEPVAIILF